METGLKTTIYLDAEASKVLSQLVAEQDRSTSQVIRRALYLSAGLPVPVRRVAGTRTGKTTGEA